MSRRINARLEDGLAGKLAALEARTGKSTTDVLRASIETYYEQVVGQGDAHVLLSDFIGCGAAEADLSERYKSRIDASLDAKAPRGGKARAAS